MTIKVKVWNGSERYSGFTTGVGKHVINMVSGLAQKPDMSVEFIVPRDRWTCDQSLRGNDPLAAIPSYRHPLSRRMTELLWLGCDRPRVDDAETDWVYAPRERYAPTTRAKKIVTVHDVYAFEPEFSGVGGPAPPLALAMLRKALSGADIIAVVSDFTANRLEMLFRADPEKIVVVGNGVEEHLFNTPTVTVSSFAPELAERYVLSVGGLTHKKGATYLLALARELETSAPDVALVICGPVAEAYRAEASSRKNLRFLGRGCSNDQMHALIAESSATLALSEYEGFGIPALEAMAAGSPVIAARRTALPEVVGDGGLLVEPSDSVSVCSAVLSVLEESANRVDLVARGRSRAAAWRWSACVERLYAAMTSSSSLPAVRNESSSSA